MSDQAHGYTIDDQRLAVQEARKVFENVIAKNEACTDNSRILAWPGTGLGVGYDASGLRIAVVGIDVAAPVDAINALAGYIANGKGEAPVVMRRQDALLENTAHLRKMIASLENALRERVERETPTVEQLKKIVEF
jgi:hypothetical protein